LVSRRNREEDDMAPRGYKIKPDRFKREMKKHKIANGTQLAKKMKMDRSTVGRVFRGDALPGPAFAMAACKVFGLEHADLFADPDQPKAKAKDAA
jgi:transcriptional regulator with XRE-family HTH domain